MGQWRLRAGQLVLTIWHCCTALALVRTVIGDSPKTKWLLIKHRDGYASKEDITAG